MVRTRKKLIEVALPLDAINAASAREKSIRHGHPSTLHLWWARRPLAAARAVIFAQMVDDPSEYVDTLLGVADVRRAAEREWRKRREAWAAKPDDAERGPEPTLAECAADLERQRLFKIIEELVKWENTTNEAVLQRARDEIWQSWRRACADNADHPRAKELFDRHKLPAFHDPFAGGGALPLEAQRLGLESYASDLNPVAVLINKAMIEIPPKFAGKPPVNPETRGEQREATGENALPGDDRLAESHGDRERALPARAAASARGDLRYAVVDYARGGVDRGQHRRGMDAGDAEGQSTLPGNRARLASGDGNAAADLRKAGMVSGGGNEGIVGASGRGQSDTNDDAAQSPYMTSRSSLLFPRSYKGAQGLAADVRYYGRWMRDEAQKRIGHLYPKIEVTAEMAEERPDLKPYVGQKLTVIAWLWARTVKSPNPAYADIDVPLASTFMLSTKPGKEAYVEPVIENRGYRFTVKVGKPKDAETAKRGTKLTQGSFECLMSGSPFRYDYIDTEANAGRMGARLMAIVAEGARGRVYLAPAVEHEIAARRAEPTWKPDTPSRGTWASNAQGRRYGFWTFGDYFTPRQLVALTTFSDLVGEARERARQDAIAAGLPDDGKPLRDGGNGATAYAEAVGVYLALALSRLTDICNALCRWEVTKTQVRNLFGRQAIPMLWDFGENNVFGEAAGDYIVSLGNMVKALEQVPATGLAESRHADAQNQKIGASKLISTDPPYYDNIGYADLSDFFYVWLRRSLRPVFPDLFSTLAVPKAEELVATTYRHGSKEKAETFFLDGMTKAMHRLAEQAHPAFPVTIYYAFKQSETESAEGTASTGWETFLDAVIRAGFGTSGTWPMRTELSNRMIGSGTNALASSIVLVCRPRDAAASSATRREFVAALKAELPGALRHLQAGNIAPVDLAQAAIGPGMAVYTRYAKVLDAEGKPVSVREALALINATLDEALAEQEGDFDADSRWALAWFEQQGFAEGDYGVAETLSKAKNTSVGGLATSGILESKRGRVRLLKPEELPANWDPATDPRLTAWEMVHHLIRVLGSGGESAAADLVAKLGARAETARELAYRLYTICERKKRAAEALAYNGLVQSWPEIVRLAQEGGKPATAAPDLFNAGER
jgi:putative DNA methylase